MWREDFDAAVLMADITGSTSLYEAAGDAAALSQINACLDGLRGTVRRAGGTVIRSKGDDVLCFFEDPSSALRAVREILSQRLAGTLRVHAGLHFGHVISERGDIFGDTVNLTARLAALAKPCEALVSQSMVERLPEVDARSLRFLDTIAFKGKSGPTPVYSLLEDDTAPLTVVDLVRDAGEAGVSAAPWVPEVVVTLRYASQCHSCEEGSSLSIGRAADCDLVIGRPWISRKHVTVSVRRGKVELDDHSSSGTHVSTQHGDEFFLRRETVLLTGCGRISLAVRHTDAKAEVVHYEVAERPRSQRL